MFYGYLIAIVLTGTFAGSLCAQDSEDARKPIEAVLQSMLWSSVLTKDHDVTVTVHWGEEEDSDLGISNEGVCKSREIFDSQSGEFWIPYARGTSESTFDSSDKDVVPIDRRYVGILIGQRDEAQETSFNGRPTRSIRKVDAIIVANPIDLLSVSTNPYAFSVSKTDIETRDFEVFLARLESLSSNQVRVTDERVDKRKVRVYRVKAVPLPTSQFIGTNRIVVSNEGHDKGHVLEISQDFMRLGDKDPYESDSQLIGENKKRFQVHWKEFETNSPDKKKLKTLLPISISKSMSAPKFKSFMSVIFEWNSFDKPKNELRSIESGEKIAKEFDAQVNKALNR